MTFNIKEYVSNAFEKAAREFMEGNHEGISIINRALHSAIIISDDEDTVFISHVISSVKNRLYKDQLEKENGQEFLRDIGSLFSSIKAAYDIDDDEQINALMRQYSSKVRNRYMELPELEKNSSDLSE